MIDSVCWTLVIGLLITGRENESRNESGSARSRRVAFQNPNVCDLSIFSFTSDTTPLGIHQILPAVLSSVMMQTQFDASCKNIVYCTTQKKIFRRAQKRGSVNLCQVKDDRWISASRDGFGLHRDTDPEGDHLSWQQFEIRHRWWSMPSNLTI